MLAVFSCALIPLKCLFCANRTVPGTLWLYHPSLLPPYIWTFLPSSSIPIILWVFFYLTTFLSILFVSNTWHITSNGSFYFGLYCIYQPSGAADIDTGVRLLVYNKIKLVINSLKCYYMYWEIAPTGKKSQESQAQEMDLMPGHCTVVYCCYYTGCRMSEMQRMHFPAGINKSLNPIYVLSFKLSPVFSIYIHSCVHPSV